MANLIVPVLIGVQFLLALVSPVLLINVSLLTGALPLTLGPNDMLSGDFGRMDLAAIRVLGLSLSMISILLFHVGDLGKHFARYKFHLIFLLFCASAAIWSPSLIYSIRMLAKLSAPFLFMLLVLSVISTTRQLATAETCVFLSGIISVALAIATKLLGRLPNADGMLTVPATSAAVFSAHLVAVSVLALAGIVTGPRLYRGILLTILASATIAAFTRITIGALFIAASVMLFIALRGTMRFALPIGGVVGLPALFLLSERFRNRMFYGGEGISVGSVMSDPSYALDHVHGSGRFPAWAQFLHLFFEPSPVIGSGIGATQHHFYTHSFTGLGVIHSEYVRLLCEVGLVGLLLFAATALAYLVHLISTYRAADHQLVKKYTLAAIGGTVAYLIFLATDNGFDYVNQFGIYVFGYIAMSAKAKELLALAEQNKIAVPEEPPSTNELGQFSDLNVPRYPILQQ